ncbi:hypothetical protein CLU79DRAFT_122501 [Phycomyces nitens]|nr:hypothetical protein CLU79DRAFT_122501 [Phycomyces nitens]
MVTKHGHPKGAADQAKVAMKIQLMEKLIEELQNDVESRERDLESIGSENQNLELALARTTEENDHLRDVREKLEKKLARRDNQITRSMERYENVNVRKEAIEAVLLRQATEGFDSHSPLPLSLDISIHLYYISLAILLCIISTNKKNHFFYTKKETHFPNIVKISTDCTLRDLISVMFR